VTVASLSRSWSAALAAVSLMSSTATFADSAASAPGSHREAASVIFDTDMYTDIDDVLALGMLHALQDRGEVKILAVTLSTEGRWTAPYIDLIDTFYGHRDIPLGTVRGGVAAEKFEQKILQDGPQPYSPHGINYTQYLAQLTNKNGSLVYPHKLRDSALAEEAVHLLRRVLSTQPDHSVVMIQVGFCTNLARLLESEPDELSKLDGRALVKSKIRLLSMMAGRFADIRSTDRVLAAGSSEFNLMTDQEAAEKLFAKWPTPIVVSGSEVGSQMLVTESSVLQAYRYVEHHPIAQTYEYFSSFIREVMKDPSLLHDHATYDLTSVLYAARPDEGYFSLSKPGKISVLPNGGTRFDPVAGGPHRYLILTDEQKGRTLEAMSMLASQPPVTRAE